MGLKASFLIETMVELPLFICFMVFILFHFRVMQTEMAVEEALSYTARFMAAGAYEDKEGSDEGLTELGEATLLFKEKLKEYDCPFQYIALGANGISLITSKLDENDIELCAFYDMNVPLTVFGSQYYRISQTAVSRKWIGDKDFGKEDEDSEWVYVTPTGSAYHSSTSCHYLDLSIRSVEQFYVGALRNKDGHIYYPCEVCGSKNTGNCFVTDYGEVYHKSLLCSGLKRTIYMVRLSEVGNRHACSKCY